MTKKQQQEIDFLEKTWNISATVEEKREYIEQTVLGGKTDGSFEKNRLFQAKRKLDMNVKMWRQDLITGLVSYEEMREDFNHPYMDKVLKGIMKGIVVDDKASRKTLRSLLDDEACAKVAMANRKLLVTQ